MTVPDLWQQQAVSALREGKDVVVHAPTGAGKTLIFELWSNAGRNRGQAIYTVPTRALANDKLAEWRARGWDVGIATGDLSENLHAPILVATLETQKNRLISGDGPALLVVDEYQMLGDMDRGLNYELALALAPPQTQFLLLSGSVANPNDVVKWLTRLGRKAVLIKNDHRPVPLEEVHAGQLSYHVPSEIRGYWPRLVAKCLAEDLGPILIFAPRRQGAESLAAEIARNLPTPNPLSLGNEQKLLVGEHLAKMLKSRICYHHSGLSYGARAGVIEPLAKAGQLRVVVATMGLAAGINFSLRSVALAAASYRRDNQEQPLKGDEILQMFGRAGRRGLDETGYVLITANELRLLDSHPCHLSRSAAVDWSALLGLMALAAKNKRDPFAEAVRVQERLFSTKPITLGVEESLKHPDTPCGLKTDAERARHVRRMVKEMLNSKGEWEPLPHPALRPVREVLIASGSEGNVTLRPAISDAAAVEKIGVGTLCVLEEKDGVKIHGRSTTVADTLADGRVVIAKWVRRMTDWNGRQAPLSVWKEKIAPLLESKLAHQKTPVVGYQGAHLETVTLRGDLRSPRPTTQEWGEGEKAPTEAVSSSVRYPTPDTKILALTSIAELPMRAHVDKHGVPLWRPVERDVLHPDCMRCDLVPKCRELSTATGTAMVWRRLKLVDAQGVPTLRGEIVSCFSQGDGLAVAAALEDPGYPLDELIYDLANLDAGFRFCGEENRWAGRLAVSCHRAYGMQSIPGYLENGVPPKYGSGAELVVASAHKNPLTKHAWVTDLLGAGDIDRIIIEWRSLLRQIAHAPSLEWPRWIAFQKLAKSILNETESPTLTSLPALEYHQTKRVEHKLKLRRH